MNIFITVVFYLFIGLIVIFFGITIYEIRKFRTDKRASFQNKSNTDIDAEDELEKELTNAKRIILITTGNCNPEFYNRPKVKTSLEAAAKRKIIIKIISGEIKEIDNPIIHLSNNYSNVQLFIIPDVYLNPHFRIIDNMNIFIEDMHKPEEKRRYFSYYVNNSYLVKKYIDLFYSLLSKSIRVPSSVDFKNNTIAKNA